MQISLNGAPHDIAEASTVEALLCAFNLEGRKIAVELNLAILPKSLYAETVLQPGDAVEIVRFIGGG